MKQQLRHRSGVCLAASLFLAVFAAVYEVFSHGVTSFWMTGAFLIPLVAGALPCALLSRPAVRQRLLPGPVSVSLYCSGLAALTAGSVFRGILEIYGTTNRLELAYWAAGLGLTSLGLTTWLLGLGGKHNASA